MTAETLVRAVLAASLSCACATKASDESAAHRDTGSTYADASLSTPRDAHPIKLTLWRFWT